jgi:hypothetical protein
LTVWGLKTILLGNLGTGLRRKSGKTQAEMTMQLTTKDAMDNSWGKYAGIGFEVAAGVGVGWLVGYWLKSRYGWNSAPLISMSVGLVAGMYLLIKQALEMSRCEDVKDKKDG